MVVIAGLVFFRERFGKYGIIGGALGTLAIILLTIS
jgi:drug/metabolite transporter (DMT)-like permease